MTNFTAYRGLPPLFDLGQTAHARLFSYLSWPWEALDALEAYLGMLLAEDPLPSGQGTAQTAAQGVQTEGAWITGDVRIGHGTRVYPGARIEGVVHIGSGCVVEPGAYIRGPAWIGDQCEVRQGAYLRGLVLAGARAVLGHASEFKRCILLEKAQAPHFNYVGDSVLGAGAHIGAGVILSNLRLDKKPVRVNLLGDQTQGMAERRLDTGLEKFGALIGDHCEVGCNTVLNPGTILGARCRVAPVSNLRGTWPENSAVSASP